MKRLLIILAAPVLILGLIWFVPHSPFSVSVENPASRSTTETTSPAAMLAENTPTVDAAIPAVIHAVYQNVSFNMPPNLAANASGASMPAGEGPLNPSPAFIQFTVNGYPFSNPDGYYNPRVRIYPADDYIKVSGWAAESLKRLKNVLANPSAPVTNDTLPNVPYMGSAAQLYAAQVKQFPFKSGNGVRMISSYAQYPAAISQHSSFYHYEGLTQDGKYFVVVEMPVVLPVYADESNLGEFGITYERKDWSQMGPYYQAVTDLLNRASPDGFNPLLSQLDALAQSITVQSVQSDASRPTMPPIQVNNSYGIPQDSPEWQIIPSGRNDNPTAFNISVLGSDKDCTLTVNTKTDFAGLSQKKETITLGAHTWIIVKTYQSNHQVDEIYYPDIYPQEYRQGGGTDGNGYLVTGFTDTCRSAIQQILARMP